MQQPRCEKCKSKERSSPAGRRAQAASFSRLFISEALGTDIADEFDPLKLNLQLGSISS